MKKKKGFNWGILIVILLIIALIVFIAFKFDSLMMNFLPGGITNQSFDDLTPSSSCILASDHNTACVGENVLFTVIDGKNARCVTGGNRNMGGWQLLESYTLNSDGRYSRSQSFNSVSNWQVAAVCQTNNSQCRTNTLNLEIINCDDNDSDYPDGDYPDDGYDYCDIDCQASGYVGGWGPVDSPGRCGGQENYVNFEFDGIGCCCFMSNIVGCSDSDATPLLPTGYNIYERGTCVYSGGIPITDTCIDDGMSVYLWEYYCSTQNGAPICLGTKVNCPYMQDACSDGACWDLN